MWNFEARNFEVRGDIFHFWETVRQKFSKYWFPQNLPFFQISRICKYSKLCFPHFLFDLPSSVRQKFLFHKTCHFSRFQIIANIPSHVFYTFCLMYPALSNRNFLTIGFHITCHFVIFKGIAKIPSYVFHTFCLIYPALSNKIFLSIGFHKFAIFFRFQGIANVPSYVPYFFLIYPALSDRNF